MGPLTLWSVARLLLEDQGVIGFLSINEEGTSVFLEPHWSRLEGLLHRPTGRIGENASLPPGPPFLGSVWLPSAAVAVLKLVLHKQLLLS